MPPAGAWGVAAAADIPNKRAKTALERKVVPVILIPFLMASCLNKARWFKVEERS